MSKALLTPHGIPYPFGSVDWGWIVGRLREAGGMQVGGTVVSM